ncbi:Uncharacterised protein [Bordetella pertussis]|nr:Uncharacterised protein [Bordetella pertussis]
MPCPWVCTRPRRAPRLSASPPALRTSTRCWPSARPVTRNWSFCPAATLVFSTNTPLPSRVCRVRVL